VKPRVHIQMRPNNTQPPSVVSAVCEVEPSRNGSIEEGERARLGRSQTRPAADRGRMKKPDRLVLSLALVFGAGRAELQPGRLRSPLRSTESFRIGAVGWARVSERAASTLIRLRRARSDALHLGHNTTRRSQAVATAGTE
jgi:hypothetical protein